MKYPVHLNKQVVVMVVTAAIVAATGLLESGRGHSEVSKANEPQKASVNSRVWPSEAALELSSSQLNAIKIEAVGERPFPVEKEAVGSIDFDENLSVQIFPPYPGKIIETFVEVGDQVHKGQPLYSIDSPDLIQAESTLIGAAATYELTSKELAREGALRNERERAATRVGAGYFR
jgi:cobalt-zinc-cadmium efflux system membrane fusion protein